MSKARSPFLSRRVLAPALALAAAGCARLLSGPPPHLYRLTAATRFPPDLPHLPGQLLVETPQAAGGLDTRRIALSRSPVSLDYYADAEWTDRAPLLIQAALVDSFENSRAITVLGRDSAGLRADFMLRSELRRFEADYRTADGPPTVRVAIGVALVRMPAGKIVSGTLVAAREPARANTVPDIVAAFDAALGRVMKEIVLWTLANPALSARR
jgi:cholesterol transport system auxiliary component